MALAKGLPAIALVDTLAMGVVLALVLAPGLPFRWRATLFCLNFYVLAVTLLVWVRPMSQIFLFAVTTLTTILLGLRAGFVSSILCTLTLLAIGLLGWAAPGFLWPGRTMDLTAWGVITLSFALVNMLVTLAIGVVLAMLDDALEREIGASDLAGPRTDACCGRSSTRCRTSSSPRTGRGATSSPMPRRWRRPASTREADLIGKVDTRRVPAGTGQRVPRRRPPRLLGRGDAQRRGAHGSRRWRDDVVPHDEGAAPRPVRRP